MKRFLIVTIFVLGVTTIFFAPEIFAQGASPGAPYGPAGASGGTPYGPNKPTGGGENVPIDGGAALLLAAGAAYGVKKIKEYKDNGKDS